MANKNNSNGLIFLFLFISTVFFMPFVSSCGKSATTANVGLNVKLEILNLSPDLHPVNLYIDFLKQNTSPYTYPYGSGYFILSSIDTPIQIRQALTTNQTIITNQNILSLDSVLKANHKYSLFITGLVADSSVTYIFTADDITSVPDIGFGKIRFVNAAIQRTGLDVTANGTIAFSKVAYKAVTKYVQMAAGNYIFQMNPTGSPTTILSTPSLQTTTIQDGRLYTLYTYGIVGGVDSARFDAGVLTNR